MNEEIIAPEEITTSPAKTPWYVSSTGDGLSLTIKGLSVVGIAETIVMIAKFMGTDLDRDTIVTGITTLAAAAGIILSVWGFVRKMWNKFSAYIAAKKA